MVNTLTMQKKMQLKLPALDSETLLLPPLLNHLPHVATLAGVVGHAEDQKRIHTTQIRVERGKFSVYEVRLTDHGETEVFLRVHSSKKTA